MGVQKKIVIFGCGCVGKLVYDTMISEGMNNVVGFTVQADYIKEEMIDSKPVVAFENINSIFPPKEHDILIALSYTNLNSIRANIIQEAKDQGYKLASFISKYATISYSAKIGNNAILFPGVRIGMNCILGEGVFIHSNTVLAHDNIISDYVWLVSNITLGGYASVGRKSFVGMGTTINSCASVGERCFIGATSYIQKNVANSSVCIQDYTKATKINSDTFLKLFNEF